MDADGAATLTLPLPVDPKAFTYFDLSLEPADGDPGHSGVSVLRGPSAAERPELVQRDRCRTRVGGLEAHGRRVRRPEAGVSVQPAPRVGAAGLQQALDEHLVEQDERQQLAARLRAAAAEQAGEQREVGRAEPAQAAVALLEDRLGQCADLAPPRRRHERVGDPPVGRTAVRLAIGAGGARGAGGGRLGEERVDGQHPAHVVGDLVEQQAVERVRGDVGEPGQAAGSGALGVPQRLVADHDHAVRAERQRGAIGALSRVAPST